MEKSSFRKKAIEKKSRGDERGFFFLKNTIFSKAIFEKINFQMQKKLEGDNTNTLFLKKLERLTFF